MKTGCSRTGAKVPDIFGGDDYMKMGVVSRLSPLGFMLKKILILESDLLVNLN